MAEFREGFLCPICMADLGDENQLIVHFDEKHSREDPAIVQNFKDLFSRAKNKIINKVLKCDVQYYLKGKSHIEFRGVFRI